MTSLASFTLSSTHRHEWILITPQVQSLVSASGLTEGICVVFVPHTTAALTLNENTDPQVPQDVQFALNAISPDRKEFRHAEGNAAAHTQTSLVGSSLTLIVTQGSLLLGTWQGIWFNEYDGPRTRTVHVRFLGEGLSHEENRFIEKP
ncbi:MAG: secondary thiamine-phosphate synthase enzyme YjbQ [Treponema sp.]|jgi:secondary thiamine-phosphate synthase enzyme|nr:secondary thiamine-phosphate synthase enzyme YjbQ [Treponema sp.]